MISTFVYITYTYMCNLHLNAAYIWLHRKIQNYISTNSEHVNIF